MIIATLIGYHVAGITGAAVATAAMCGPTCIATFFVARTWDRFRDAPWRIAIQAGLVPLSVGLIAASAWVLAVSSPRNGVAVVIMLATATIGYFTRINPLWVFAVAAIIGVIGYI